MFFACMRKGEACIGCGDGGGWGSCVCVCVGGGGGVCVCVCVGGGVINILYPWESTDEYPISLLYIPCNISIFILLNIHKSTELDFKYTTYLVLKCQISHIP